MNPTSTSTRKVREARESLNRCLHLAREQAELIRAKKKSQLERLDRCYFCGEPILVEDLQFFLDEDACPHCTAVFRRMMAD